MDLTATGEYVHNVAGHLWGWADPEPPYWLYDDPGGEV